MRNIVPEEKRDYDDTASSKDEDIDDVMSSEDESKQWLKEKEKAIPDLEERKKKYRKANSALLGQYYHLKVSRSYWA